jgi:hypothetical protein
MSTQPPPLTPPLHEVSGPIPEDNLPGHHPEHEQDKPEVPPNRRPRRPRAEKATPALHLASEATQTSAPVEASPVVDTSPVTSPSVPAGRRFAFAIDPTMAYFSRLFGVTDDNAWVEVGDSEVVAKFGPWVLRTPRKNVAGATVTGPYAWAKVVGGPRLSFRDRGLTFATTTRGGVCIRFKEPVGGVFPVPLLRHPGLTVTPDDPEGLLEALRS